jgi:EAL domain-containing protein (putative c-di-GMP-specific phosphodiesterase class I)/GGDEF domain-containing protein
MTLKTGILKSLFGERSPVSAVRRTLDPRALLAALEQDIRLLKGAEVLALLIISLSRSDSVDASLGLHGSRLIQESILDRVRSTLRPQDYLTLATVDEVWVVLPKLTSATLANLAATNIARALEAPFIDNHTVVTVRPGIGISVAVDADRPAISLLKAASHARSLARTLNQPYFVTNSSGDTDQISRNLILDLEAALADNLLSLAYQPKVDLSTRQVISVEALIRWPSEVKPTMTPTALVGIAEKFGMMEELTRYVLHTAIGDYVNILKAAGISRIWVNLSARMLCEPHLPDLLQQVLDVWGVPTWVLGLEVTESTLITDIEQSITMLHTLKRAGFEIAIDDFGTGYSSLAYLRRFPISELKIDKIFVQHMLSSESDIQIVRSIIDLAHNFKLKVVAEGVEDDATLAVLEQMGCDQIQGYIFAKPMPAKELVPWMAAFNKFA